jgi:2-oxoglutarate ferredoxin oxidoreductase subunit alpha
MILADGIVGQMMEKVVLPDYRPRRTEEEIRQQCPWAANGRKDRRKRNVVTSLELESSKMEVINERLQARYREIERNETRWEEIGVEGADYLMVAFGSVARICDKAREIAAEKGIKVGIVRPITLWPFPTEAIAKAAQGKKGILCVELNAGQMIEDVRLAVHDSLPVEHFGRLGGIIPSPDEVLNALEQKIIKH